MDTLAVYLDLFFRWFFTDSIIPIVNHQQTHHHLGGICLELFPSIEESQIQDSRQIMGTHEKDNSNGNGRFSMVTLGKIFPKFPRFLHVYNFLVVISTAGFFELHTLGILARLLRMVSWNCGWNIKSMRSVGDWTPSSYENSEKTVDGRNPKQPPRMYKTL